MSTYLTEDTYEQLVTALIDGPRDPDFVRMQLGLIGDVWPEGIRPNAEDGALRCIRVQATSRLMQGAA